MTLISMTGFARDSATFGDYVWSWELKSVNAKGLDVRPRLPPGFEALEPRVRSQLTAAFKRGNIGANLQISKTGSDSAYRINEAHLEHLMSVAKDLQARNPDMEPPSVDGMLALRGVIEADDDVADEESQRELHNAVLGSLERAAAALHTAREEEGARLEEALGEFVNALSTLRANAAETAEAQVEAIRGRLRDQVAVLIDDAGALDPGRLEHEAAILMTKADIREELDRLAAHICAVEELLAAGDAVGRRLDFLCQELNREANTICSKAQETALTRIGLDLKATIEQLREQVQNIE